MRALALTAFVLTAPLAQANSELDALRQRCSEQERQIAALETEIESLHSKLALERRRSRGSVDVAEAPAAVPVSTSYTVKAGDTLSSIARRNGTTAGKLMSLNGITDPTRLRIGQTIQVTGSSAPVAKAPAPAPAKAAPPVAAAKESRPETYKVQRGDTFYKIARDHEITVSKLQALNPGVNPSHIIVGQTLGVAGDPRPAVAQASKARSTNLITTPTPAKKAAPKPAVTSAPAPAPKPAPKPATKSLPKPAAKPAPAPLPEKKEEPKPTTYSSIIVMDQISFADFARKHGSSPDQLNALNGLNLKPGTLLAKGSELYVPGR